MIVKIIMALKQLQLFLHKLKLFSRFTRISRASSLQEWSDSGYVHRL